MTVNTTVELFTCLFSFLCGLAAGFIYDFLSIIICKEGKVASFFKELFYFTVLAFISVNVIRFVNDGVFRAYELVFLIVGVLGYVLVFGSIVQKILKALLKAVYVIMKFIVKIFIYPLIFILSPVKRLFFKKYLQICKKISKNRLTMKQICFRIIMYMGEIKRFYKHK
ncbi:MAG: spore cortex biosynthesis protein YabQ [Clostridia bacterium]|nr:spore cortex biosynthesis protein YabQ [Clostridia bacterium]